MVTSDRMCSTSDDTVNIILKVNAGSTAASVSELGGMLRGSRNTCMGQIALNSAFKHFNNRLEHMGQGDRKLKIKPILELKNQAKGIAGSHQPDSIFIEIDPSGRIRCIRSRDISCLGEPVQI